MISSEPTKYVLHGSTLRLNTCVAPASVDTLKTRASPTRHSSESSVCSALTEIHPLLATYTGCDPVARIRSFPLGPDTSMAYKSSLTPVIILSSQPNTTSSSRIVSIATSPWGVDTSVPATKQMGEGVHSRLVDGGGGGEGGGAGPGGLAGSGPQMSPASQSPANTPIMPPPTAPIPTPMGPPNAPKPAPHFAPSQAPPAPPSAPPARRPAACPAAAGLSSGGTDATLYTSTPTLKQSMTVPHPRNTRPIRVILGFDLNGFAPGTFVPAASASLIRRIRSAARRIRSGSDLIFCVIALKSAESCVLYLSCSAMRARQASGEVGHCAKRCSSALTSAS